MQATKMQGQWLWSHIVAMHSGPNQGVLSNGYIIKYFLKFLKNIFMLTKIFEETLPWLVKILKTDQQ